MNRLFDAVQKAALDCGATARRALCTLVILSALVASSGCAYLTDRGRDALDIFNVGVLVSNHASPEGGLYLGFWHLFDFGYAHVDGKLIGIANGQAGVFDFVQEDSWGVIVWGAEQYGVGSHLQADAVPRYDQGVLRLALGTENKAPFHEYFDCDRTLHIGWIGLHLRIKLDELADFILGWGGLDIMKDDRVPRGEPVSPPAGPLVSPPAPSKDGRTAG